MTMLCLSHRTNPCVRFRTLTLAVTLAITLAGHSQVQRNAPTLTTDGIASTLHLIQAAEDEKISEGHLGYLWAVLAAQYRVAGNFTASEDAYFKAIRLLERSPSAAQNYATALDNLAMLYLTYGRLDEAELYNRKGAKVRSMLGIPLDEARSEAHMSQIELARHKFRPAESGAAHAFEEMMRLDDPNPIDEISVLNALATARCSLKACAQGIKDAQRSLDLARNSFGEESAIFAHSMMALGFAEWKLNRVEEADLTMRSAIQRIQEREGQDSIAALLSMIEYRNYLKGVHRQGDAENITQQVALALQKQPAVCRTCVNVGSLSNALK